MNPNLLRLARLGARMRWTITRNSLRRRGRALFALTIIASAGGAIAGFTTFAGAALMEPDPRRAVLLAVMNAMWGENEEARLAALRHDDDGQPR